MTYQATRSQQLFTEAQTWLAGGVGSGTRSPRSGWLPSPIYIERGEGAHLWDVDGPDSQLQLHRIAPASTATPYEQPPWSGFFGPL